MSDFLRTELEKAQQCLLETYELAASYGDNEEKDTSKYLLLMEQICQIRDNCIRNDRALEMAIAEHTIDSFQITFQREIKGPGKKFQAKRTREYKAFADRLDEISNSVNTSKEAPSTSKDGASNEMEMQVQVNLNDPLTKRRMVDPVKNTICGHTYEKSSIQDAIQINPMLRCPVAGCGNNQYITTAHLKPDKALKLHLQRLVDADENGDNDD
ncbi:unnamed protein product [Ceratitis capitata]|uniref:E3 SUMO-protein ligase NSE2 n=1 Tax=Ceratitis capitata TaxID=7213 RepID=A0A811VLA6_CERCA|nr:unnamed protein product [Ceratitis capitata]